MPVARSSLIRRQSASVMPIRSVSLWTIKLIPKPGRQAWFSPLPLRTGQSKKTRPTAYPLSDEKPLSRWYRCTGCYWFQSKPILVPVTASNELATITFLEQCKCPFFQTPLMWRLAGPVIKPLRLRLRELRINQSISPAILLALS